MLLAFQRSTFLHDESIISVLTSLTRRQLRFEAGTTDHWKLCCDTYQPNQPQISNPFLCCFVDWCDVHLALSQDQYDLKLT